MVYFDNDKMLWDINTSKWWPATDVIGNLWEEDAEQEWGVFSVSAKSRAEGKGRTVGGVARDFHKRRRELNYWGTWGGGGSTVRTGRASIMHDSICLASLISQAQQRRREGATSPSLWPNTGTFSLTDMKFSHRKRKQWSMEFLGEDRRIPDPLHYSEQRRQDVS